MDHQLQEEIQRAKQLATTQHNSNVLKRPLTSSDLNIMIFISVKESEQSPEIVELPLEQNRLTIITLKETFPGASGLFYRTNDRLKAVGVISRDHVVNEPFFKEPIDGWTGKIYFTLKQPKSRPTTPVIEGIPTI
uniref:TAR DNA-binding protein 43 N-terminal domain-containing protein n=1 Tax=Acrobeloides nanus TaxID=290746 RepID=A0A914D5X8_9BILA